MAAAIPPKVSQWFDVFVSIAAAVVLFGALQKLLHSPIADLMLKIGLYTEAAIFLGYGVLYVIYPAIDDHEVHLPGGAKVAAAPANAALDKLNDMFEDAGINADSLSKLSAGFTKLNTSVDQISQMSEVVASTGDFSVKAREAGAALGGIKDAATNAAQSLAGFQNATEGAKMFHEQMQSLNKNLSSLNTIYELELQEGNNHLKALNQFYGKLAEASNAMTSSAEDAIKAKEQIAALASNLGRLNQLYGNMLTAMQGR
ncbi:type IX secretion system motor protein PorL/GldL [Sediminibacterium soli]|uniref:type IX secretion system motor protein PorL/GldL n=1 Tax=Sediminibacterium soli TaxID=2698829 RepID=UPI0013797C27|nr:gliding motility protein GldL [Sediminibacterium soli]NCI45431.1 gliding motility protein GldL [Sediminibacterium soli]